MWTPEEHPRADITLERMFRSAAAARLEEDRKRIEAALDGKNIDDEAAMTQEEIREGIDLLLQRRGTGDEIELLTQPEGALEARVRAWAHARGIPGDAIWREVIGETVTMSDYDVAVVLLEALRDDADEDEGAPMSRADVNLDIVERGNEVAVEQTAALEAAARSRKTHWWQR